MAKITTVQIEFHDGPGTSFEPAHEARMIETLYPAFHVYDDGISKSDGIYRMVVTPYDRTHTSIDINDSDSVELLAALADSAGMSIKDYIKELAQKELDGEKE